MLQFKGLFDAISKNISREQFWEVHCFQSIRLRGNDPHNFIFTLTEALKAIEGRPDFIKIQHEDLTIIDYVYAAPDSFEGIRANLRGTTFYGEEIVSLPLEKFTLVTDINHGSIYEKLDGTMVHFYYHNGLRSSTRKNPNAWQAKRAMELVDKVKVLQSISKGLTPIFEYVGPDNKVVLNYPERLVYLVSRNIKTGEYVHEDYPDSAQRFKINPKDHLQDLMEGFVVYSDKVYKIKSPWYIHQHKMLEYLQCPYKIRMAALDNLDLDLMEHKEFYENIKKEVAQDYFNLYNDAKELRFTENKKELALYYKDHPLFHFILCFPNVDRLIRQTLKERYKNISRSIISFNTF